MTLKSFSSVPSAVMIETCQLNNGWHSERKKLVTWDYGQILHPYGVDPNLPLEADCIGRTYFACNPAVTFGSHSTTYRKKPSARCAIADGKTTMTTLPTPQQWVIRRMTEPELAEMIERHIDFVDKEGRSVHLPTSFLRHYMRREDNALPTIVAVSTLPLVLADGHVLAEDRFDRLRGIDFRIQPRVAATVPKARVTEYQVEKAMRFLTDEWLVDVATDYAGKCTIVAAALTLIERSLLDQRPAFFVTAGRRGGGKTTTLVMLIKAVSGIWPAAAAWSTNEEERRKALLSYFLYGVPYILWDNIAHGSQISCPHIEKSCTAAYYSDRKLGVSEMVATAASTIHFFTGNNIGPRGDLASRSLEIRLELDRYDPENRKFKHPDPIGWTDSTHAEILGALYTILLGNPMLKKPRNAPTRTRFKMWYRLVGSAVEHAAMLANPDREVDFQKLFLAREDDDEDSTSLADALAIMVQQWPTTFDASQVARLVNDQTEQHGAALREFLYPGAPTFYVATPKSVGKRLTKPYR